MDTLLAEIPRVSLSRIVVKPPPNIVGIGSIDTFLAIDQAVEMAVLLDETQIALAKCALSDRSGASGHVPS